MADAYEIFFLQESIFFLLKLNAGEHVKSTFYKQELRSVIQSAKAPKNLGFTTNE
jgi:hypothetical protein